MMKTYQGACHCGAITFRFRTEDIVRAERCDCSICVRKGSVLTHETIPAERFEFTVEGDALATYQFGTFVARHHFCRICGVHTFVESRFTPGEYRVNLGCVDGLDALRLPYEIFDGKSV